MKIAVALPSLGDDDDAVHEAEVAAWLVEAGAHIEKDADLLEITTDKAAFVVPAPQSGRVLSFDVTPGQTIAVGTVLCQMEVQEEPETSEAEAASEL